MSRPLDWPARLSAFVAAKRTTPFAWAVNDCCIFASDWVLALTGRDPAADLRGAYSTALGAVRVLKEKGGVIAIADTRLAEFGWAREPVKYAKRGDIVATLTKHGAALGVCAGQDSIFAGNIKLRTLESIARWRIE